MNQKSFQNNFQNHLDRTVKSVFSTIDEFGMLSGGDRVLVSISGGPDSTFLTLALNMLKKTYNLKLFAFHLDHMTRNGESSKDAEFVAGLCKDLGIKLFASRTDARQWCRQHKLSFQEGARKLRLQFLTQAADKCRADRIATGHNADDNVETFFMHLARGAGLKGLSGIRPVSSKFIRPLIRTSRNDIMRYLESNQIPYCTDKTNLENTYFRNKIRNVLMPYLKDKFSNSFDKQLLKSIEFIRQDNDLISSLAEKEFKKTASLESNPATGEIFLVKLPLTRLAKMHPSLAKRIIIKSIELVKGDIENIKSKNLEAILKISAVRGESRQVKLVENIISYKEGKFLYIFNNNNTREPFLHVLNLSGSAIENTEFASEIQPGTQKRIEELGILAASEVLDKNITAINYKDASNTEAYLDFDKIIFPLKVKQWHPGSGDRFYPLGIAGSKKIHDFLMDLKIPKSSRALVPIFFDANKIVWVGGFRIDARVKIST
ncbi:MAG: tRNA lysidine(34) synthetase TilS, partial [Candidatus Atribacteria bacterium]|nr:tRNA lysidine(34) synthetase TilS [Candidatus Atribacteria bacterium]